MSRLLFQYLAIFNIENFLNSIRISKVCSKFYQILNEAFKFANLEEAVFKEIPMTFKKYKSKEFHPAFVQYYKKQKKKIPEGKKGTNPAQISRYRYLTLYKLY